MAVRFKDYYEILGVQRTASAEEIRRAFRDLARRYHPDVNKDAGAVERFKEINEAYEVLKDPEKRSKYDALGSGFRDGQDFSPPPGWEGVHFDFGGGTGGPAGFSEFFSMLFGRGGAGAAGGFEDLFGGRGPRVRTPPRRGADAEATLELTLEELAAGGKRPIQLQEASGRTRSYEVAIPPGTTDGTRIRLAGQGEPGRDGAPPGDLFLRVRVLPHPRFEVEGTDLRTRIDIAPWEAALGASVDVPTLTGTAVVKVAPGTPSGRILRLRGQGLPREGGRGDLLLTVRITVPAAETDEERALWEQLARESKFRPRGQER